MSSVYYYVPTWGETEKDARLSVFGASYTSSQADDLCNDMVENIAREALFNRGGEVALFMHVGETFELILDTGIAEFQKFVKVVVTTEVVE